jgi:hypothetical protein
MIYRTIFWKPITGFPNYMVSCTGEVLSLVTENPLKMKQCFDSKGYLFVNISNENGNKAMRVHRLVGNAFLGLDLDNQSICILHRDDNPKNNNLSNLFVGTQIDNMKDMKDKSRNHHPSLRFSMEEVGIIRERLKNGETGNKLAKEFKVSISLISAIRNNKRYVKKNNS